MKARPLSGLRPVVRALRFMISGPATRLFIPKNDKTLHKAIAMRRSAHGNRIVSSAGPK
jgi:hypothetical protein